MSLTRGEMDNQIKTLIVTNTVGNKILELDAVLDEFESYCPDDLKPDLKDVRERFKAFIGALKTSSSKRYTNVLDEFEIANAKGG